MTRAVCCIFIWEHHIWSVWKANPITPVGENDPLWPTTAAPHTRLMIESGMMPAVFTPNKMTQCSHRITLHCNPTSDIAALLSDNAHLFCSDGMPAHITWPDFRFPEETSLRTEKTGSPGSVKEIALKLSWSAVCTTLYWMYLITWLKMSHCWLKVSHLTMCSPSH